MPMGEDSLSLTPTWNYSHYLPTMQLNFYAATDMRHHATSCLSEQIRQTNLFTVKILCIGTDRPQQTVETKIRLLLKKQSDQGLRCLPLHQLLLDALMQCYIKLYQF